MYKVIPPAELNYVVQYDDGTFDKIEHEDADHGAAKLAITRDTIGCSIGMYRKSNGVLIGTYEFGQKMGAGSHVILAAEVKLKNQEFPELYQELP